MALITCPDCQHAFSDASPACIQCGRPNGGVAAAASTVGPISIAGEPGARRERSPFACVQCGSEDVRKLSMIFREGYATTETNTVGIGVARGGLGVGGAKSRGQSQTLASLGASPPEQKKVMLVLLAAALFGFYVLSAISSGQFPFIALIIVGVCGWLAWSRFQYNRDVHPLEFARWNASYRCNRCEAVYQVTPA